jgi:hypothetical protein
MAAIRFLVFAVAAVWAAGAANDAANAAPIGNYPDADSEKHCSAPGDSPECVLKTFWACNEKSVATCKKAGLDVQPDGAQHRDDGDRLGEIMLKPWTIEWSEILDITNPADTVWEVRGFREVVPRRLRGVAGSRRRLAGTHEIMIGMVSEAGEEVKQSVFVTQRKGQWMATGFMRWKGKDNQPVDLCQRRKLGSLGCRYTLTGLTPWTITESPLPPAQPAPQ